MKENHVFIRMLAYLITMLATAFVVTNCLLYLSCFNVSHQLNENNPKEFLRIKIYGSSTTTSGLSNTVSGTFSIIDSNGNEIAVIERSWSGSYLGVEFVQADFNGKYYLFPSKIYGKNRIIEERRERKHGSKLEKYYNEDGQCLLLGHGSTLSDRQAMYKISIFATHKYHFLTFGLTSRYNIDLSGCKPDRYYSIGCDDKGNLIIREL